MAARVNITAVLGWAVASGRLHWSKEQETRAAYECDPVQTLGRLLVANPSPGRDQPCPLFSPLNAKISRAAKKTWAERKHREQAVADTVTAAITATLHELGHDPEDTALRALVKQQMLYAEERAKQAARTAARAASAEQRRIARDDGVAASFASFWD